MRFNLQTVLLATAVSGVVLASPAMAFQGSNLSDGNGAIMMLTRAATDTVAKDAGGVQVGAEKFINSMARRALDFLGNAQQTQSQKAESFRRLLEDNYDMETIGRFTLGRYWKTATPQQRTEYQRLFKKRVVEMYSNRFSEYKGQKFETTGVRADGDKDTIVSSKIIPADGGSPIEVDWRVRYSNGQYNVVDVIVAGVSMSVTQRSDFASVIQQGGGDVQALIEHLRQKT